MKKRLASVHCFGSLALSVGLVLSSPAVGQTAVQATSPGPAKSDPEIIVTGTRISGGGFQTPTPVTVLSAGDLAKAGISSVGQIMSQVPAFRASISPASTTTSSQNAGAALFDLRGLGPGRSLLLVNGRRFVPTTTSATVDTNVIPSALVDRVEVVTGGASAAYGSDAVSGVINLILKRNIDGFAGTVQSGISTHGDNADLLGSIGWGRALNGNRGHISLAVEGQDNKGVPSQMDRDWSRRAPGLISNPAYTATNGQYRQYIADNFQLASATVGGLITSGNLRGTQFLPGGATAPFVYGQYAGAYQIGGGGVNAGNYTAITVPFKRRSAYGTADYDFGRVTAFVEGSYAFSEGYNRNNVLPFHLGNITIQRDNAYLPAAIAAAMTGPSFTMGRYDTDLRGIGAKDSNRTTRLIGGLKGAIGGGWSWNAYGEYGHTFYHSMLPNNINVARFNRSVDAVRNGAGQIVCRVNVVAVTDPACVPVNLFGTGSPLATPGAIAYFSGTTDYRVKIDERVGSGSVQGPLFDISGKPVTVAAGVEYRSEAIVGTSDAVSQAGGWLIGNPQPERGSYTVKEAFGEIQIPLLHDLLFARSLGLNGAIRITDYSTSGTVVTWKAGGVWQVNDDIRLRVTRSHDIRAPNFDELFTNALFRFSTVTDPFRNNQQLTVQQISQGNRGLRPEVGNTLTGGVILTPRFVPGLRMSIDYYDIRIRGAITTLGAQDVVNRCFAGNSSLCALLSRDASGALTSILTQYINLSKLSTRGLDLEVAYRLPLSQLGAASAGVLTLRGLATYVDRLTFDDGIVATNRAGDVGYGHNGLPHWKANASVTYDDDRFTAFLQARYVGGGKYDVTYGPFDLFNNRIKGRAYVDASIAYNVVENGRERIQFFLNVNNLFDRDPPADPNNFFVPQATNTVLYDVVGRMISAGIRFKF